MLLPTAVDVLRCAERTLETIIVPTLPGVGERSAAATIGHMLRHVALRIEREGQMLYDEIGVLRPLLAQVETYLGTTANDDRKAAQLRADFAALLERRFAADGYRGVASLAEEVSSLRQGVCDALMFVQKQPPGSTGAAAMQDALHRYIAWEAEQEAQIIDAAFEGFGPRR
jgi:hypothetical protein